MSVRIEIEQFAVRVIDRQNIVVCNIMDEFNDVTIEVNPSIRGMKIVRIKNYVFNSVYKIEVAKDLRVFSNGVFEVMQ